MTINTRFARLLAASALALCLGLSGVATAQGAGDGASEGDEDAKIARVEALSQEATELFGKGRYKEAISAFKKANALTPVATLLYNIALCYDKLNDSENARIYYEEFILAPDAEADLRARALSRIKEIEKESRGSRIGVIKDDKNNGGGKGTGDGNDKTGDEGIGGLTMAGIITGVGGLALIGGGGVFGGLTLTDQSTFDNSRDLAEKQQAKDDATQKALIADILYSAGAVALVTGAVLIAMDLGSEEQAPTGVRWTPLAGPGTLGAAVTIPLGGP